MWDSLKKGDIVDLIAPGYGIKPNEIQPCKEYIESLGLIARVSENLLGDDPFSSHNEEERAKQLIHALLAEDSKAIWCLKGGYGTANIIPALEKITPPTKQKLVIGFSDITALHLFLNNKWGWSTLHGAVVWQLMKNRINAQSIALLNDIIFGKNTQQHYPLTPLNNFSNDITEGKITGGNLMLIQSSVATSWQIRGENNIIFIEDIDERAYRVERILIHLQQAGIFDHTKAVIFGDFVCEEIEDQSENITLVLQRFAKKMSFPVFKISGIGHGEINHPLPLGTKSKITCTDSILTCNNK